MDLLCRAYSDPLNLMNMYINQGRFGMFVQGFLEAEYERRKADAEKNNEWMLWVAYVHSYSSDNFNDWKKKHCGAGSSTKKTSDANLTEDEANKIIDNLFKG